MPTVEQDNSFSSQNVTQSVTLPYDYQPSQVIITWVCCIFSIIVVFGISTWLWYRERHAVGLKKRLKKRKEKRESAQTSEGIKAVSTAPIRREDFIAVYQQKLKDECIKYELPAIKMPSYPYSCFAAQQPHNTEKNFSPKYLPYDYNRVRLNSIRGDITTDYINASYIYETKCSTVLPVYIATQGPLSTTINDFWKMVWQEESKCIIMLTDIFSYAKQECIKYWHDTYTLCGDIHVMQESCDYRLHYTTRKFVIGKVGSKKTRPVYHFLFHGWTKKEVPDVLGLLSFRNHVNNLRNTFTAPTIVHCTTGSGRTGAYIALDRAMSKMGRYGVVDILNTIVSLRKYRFSFVTDTILLETIYKAFYMRFLCGQTSVSINARSISTHLTISLGLDGEYKLLRQLIPDLSVGECAAGHRNENRYKSRDIMTQPPESARPHLMTFDLTDSSDFINAVYVDGYRTKNECIVGQWPVKTSITDFWRLVLDARIVSTVVLHSLEEASNNYPIFWPTNLHSCERYGPIAVTLIETAETSSYSVRTFSVRKFHLNTKKTVDLFKHSLTVRIVFFKLWPNADKLLDNADHLISLIEDVSKHTVGGLTFVMSRVGVKRAGLYCALSICLQELINDEEVDVFNAVRTVKKNRPSLVNQAEYVFLNDTINGLIRRMLRNKGKDISHLPANSACSSIGETLSTGTTLESIADSSC